MKYLRHFYFILFMLGISIYAQSQNIEYEQQENSIFTSVKASGDVPTFFIEATSYIITEPEFKYNGTIPLNYGEIMNIDLPFAAVDISNNKLSIRINQESFMWYLYKSPFKEQGFFDLQVPIYDQIWTGGGYVSALIKVGIIRIVFKEN